MSIDNWYLLHMISWLSWMTPDVFDDDSNMEQEKVMGLKESSAKVDVQKLPKLQRVLGRLPWQKPKTGFILLLFAMALTRETNYTLGFSKWSWNIYSFSYQQAVL